MNTEFWKNATPEQINLWNIASALIAYQTITPIYYQGVIAGSEFLTYNAGKLYIALEIESTIYTLNISINIVNLYDMANAQCSSHSNFMPYWDATAALAKAANNTVNIKNCYFSRLTCATYIKFNGYRLDV